MRFVERQAAMKKLGRRRYSTSISSATLTTVDDVTERVSLCPGLTVVCGGNGAGKSTMLGALWRCLSGVGPLEPARAPRVPPWLRSLRVEGLSDGQPWTSELGITPNESSSAFSDGAHYIDAAAETLEMLRLFSTDSQPTDLLEGIDPLSFGSEQLELMSYILRRTYDEVLIHEITAFSPDDAPLPYFTVSSMGKTYPLELMGRGELAAAFLLWRLSDIPKGAIVLIEEPESHLAASSQECLVDAIVSAAVEKDLCLVVSSHSPGFFQKLPARHLRLVSSLPTFRMRSELSSFEISSHLGYRAHTAAVLFVEDRVAAEFAYAILSAVDRDVLRQVEIKFVTSGESGVGRLVDDVRDPWHPSGMTIVGLLDGDQRVRESGPRTLGRLIGDGSPELVLKQAAEQWRSDPQADWEPVALGGAEALRLSLERVDGRDPHDWLMELGRDFGGVRLVVIALVDLVLRDGAMSSAAAELASWIRETANLAD